RSAMKLPRRLRRDESAELVQHLDELRSRLIIALMAVAVGFAVAYAFHGRLLDWLNQSLPPDKRHPVTFGIPQPFMTSIKVSLVAGIAVALPILLWQLWSFLAPAFDERARRAVAGFTLFATGLFVAGAIFAKTVALPAALAFLTSYDSDHYDIMVRA